MLDFRIDTFLAVCRHMNFTKAAQELNITQPAVSHHIRGLEEYYHTRLFEYTNKNLKLTEAGRMLLQTAATMKHDEIHLRQWIQCLGNSGRKIVFGATMTIGEYLMPEAFMRLLEKEPQCTIHMVVSDTRDLLSRIDGGELEFAVVEGFFPKKDYESLVYDTQRLMVVCGPDYDFAGEICSVEDLTKETLLMREEGSGTRYVTERYLQEHNLLLQDFTRMMEISSIGAIKSLVMKGVGITIVYEAGVEKEVKEGRLKEVEVPGFQLYHDFSFIWRKGSIYRDYYQNMYEILHG